MQSFKYEILNKIQGKALRQSSGQAALIAVFFMMMIMLSAVMSGTALSLGEERAAVINTKARRAFFAAEAGIDDAVYRTKQNKNMTSSFSLTLNGATAQTSVNTTDGERTISSQGTSDAAVRAARAVMNINVDAVQFFYGVHVGDGGLAMANNAVVNGNVYSNGNIVGGSNGSTITGDATAAGSGKYIKNVIVGDANGGTGRASQFINATIHGSLCPNSYCIVENPSREELPISDDTIQDWKNDAETGGICAPPTCDSSGNFILTNGNSVSLGPVKVSGNLTLDNGSTLMVTGTIWVAGKITLSNNCIVELSGSYEFNSGIIISDNITKVSNNCEFYGSGNSKSHLMLLTTKNAPNEEVLEVDNNALGVIYYAKGGRLKFKNNATAKEATAYGITMDNNATITYESGLANVNFSSGPSGGWSIDSWEEVEP